MATEPRLTRETLDAWEYEAAQHELWEYSILCDHAAAMRHRYARHERWATLIANARARLTTEVTP